MKRSLLLILMIALCVFVVGCKDSSIDVQEPASDTKLSTDRISLSDSTIEMRDKLYNACFFDKDDKPVKTTEESLDYIKNILPEGIEEIENVCEENKGTTKLKYKVEDVVFYVFILHPHNGDSTYDLKSASGISFPRIEIDTNWQSE